MENRIKEILEKRFQIDLENSSVIFETMIRKNDPEQFDTVKELYKKRINENENRSLYLSDDIIIHIQQIIPKDEIGDTSGDYSFYYPICSKEEFKRIKNIQNADDYLLKIRADSIADDPRFSRVFFSRYQKKKKNNQSWSITDYYKTNKFKKYINRLSPNLKNKKWGTFVQKVLND